MDIHELIASLTVRDIATAVVEIAQQLALRRRAPSKTVDRIVEILEYYRKLGQERAEYSDPGLRRRDRSPAEVDSAILACDSIMAACSARTSVPQSDDQPK